MQTEIVMMPRELTAENGAKKLLIGEFCEHVELPCPECFDLGETDEDCPTCEGSGTYMGHVDVSWTTIKEIYRKAVEHLAT